MPILTSVLAGASGGALANVALSPLGGGAGMLQSYWYGAGLILGERDMYTFHWEKIKKRLEGGEDYLSVLESEMNPAITAIASYSLQIMQKTGDIYLQGGIDFMASLIENLFKLLAGEAVTTTTTHDHDLHPQDHASQLIQLTLAQVQAMSDNELKQALTQQSKYENFTNSMIATEHKKRFTSTSDTKTEQFDIRTVLWKKEAEYLKQLLQWDLTYIRVNEPFKHDLALTGYIRTHYGALTTRKRSSGSDAKMRTFEQALIDKRRKVLDLIAKGFNPDDQHRWVNVWHTLLYIHKLVYI